MSEQDVNRSGGWHPVLFSGLFGDHVNAVSLTSRWTMSIRSQKLDVAKTSLLQPFSDFQIAVSSLNMGFMKCLQLPIDPVGKLH